MISGTILVGNGLLLFFKTKIESEKNKNTKKKWVWMVWFWTFDAGELFQTFYLLKLAEKGKESSRKICINRKMRIHFVCVCDSSIWPTSRKKFHFSSLKCFNGNFSQYFPSLHFAPLARSIIASELGEKEAAKNQKQQERILCILFGFIVVKTNSSINKWQERFNFFLRSFCVFLHFL